MNYQEKYLKTFGELPKIPIMCSMSRIKELMEEAIIRKEPLTQEEINEAFKDIDEEYDIEIIK